MSLILEEAARGWLREHAELLARFGFTARIVGSVSTQGGSAKDLDVLLSSVPRSLESQLESFYRFVAPSLGLTSVAETPLEAWNHSHCWFISSTGPQGWPVEFYFEDRFAACDPR